MRHGLHGRPICYRAGSPKLQGRRIFSFSLTEVHSLDSCGFICPEFQRVSSCLDCSRLFSVCLFVISQKVISETPDEHTGASFSAEPCASCVHTYRRSWLGVLWSDLSSIKGAFLRLCVQTVKQITTTVSGFAFPLDGRKKQRRSRFGPSCIQLVHPRAIYNHVSLLFYADITLNHVCVCEGDYEEQQCVFEQIITSEKFHSISIFLCTGQSEVTGWSILSCTLLSFSSFFLATASWNKKEIIQTKVWQNQRRKPWMIKTTMAQLASVCHQHIHSLNQ